jgi:hypothetical protein
MDGRINQYGLVVGPVIQMLPSVAVFGNQYLFRNANGALQWGMVQVKIN